MSGPPGAPPGPAAQGMTYDDAIRFLYGLRLHGLKLGLDHTRRLAALSGNPQDRLQFIHVAGTNGKGSTCALLESIYRASGRRVGLFTSPHLVSFRERIQVNRQLIHADDVVRGVAALQAWLPEFDPQHPPTFFEVVTVLALRHFAEQGCDLVIWETGMGGRLDATNIVTPLASVITNIQLDHEKWLGNTVAQIAAEKAGILKPGIPALTGADDPEALAVIRETARRQGSPLTRVDASTAAALTRGLPLGLPGRHQQRNAGLAVATVQQLHPRLPVTPEQLRAGLHHVDWPGRLQQLRRPGGQVILLDGAHNPGGVETLRQALETDFAGQTPTLILGILEDKDWTRMCRQLAPLARQVLLVPVKSERTAPPALLQAACHGVHPHPAPVACADLADALDRAGADPFVVVTGSLYLVGEALELLGLGPAAGSHERALNEWGGAPSRPGGPLP